MSPDETLEQGRTIQTIQHTKKEKHKNSLHRKKLHKKLPPQTDHKNDNIYTF